MPAVQIKLPPDVPPDEGYFAYIHRSLSPFVQLPRKAIGLGLSYITSVHPTKDGRSPEN